MVPAINLRVLVLEDVHLIVVLEVLVTKTLLEHLGQPVPYALIVTMFITLEQFLRVQMVV